MKAVSIDTEFHKYPDVGHGYGTWVDVKNKAIVKLTKGGLRMYTGKEIYKLIDELLRKE